MYKKIIIYGTSKEEFPKEHDLIDYLSTGLSQLEEDRFRYTQCKDTDVIVISRNGLAYGHLIVNDKIKPTKKDIKNFPPVKCTYLINKSVVYNNPVKLYNDFGIRVSSFGTYITQEQFEEILKKAS